MNNLFFKSPETYEKLINKLDVMLTEQRKQRSDLSQILRMLQKLINDANLQKQVDEYFDEDTEHIPEEKPEVKPWLPLEDSAKQSNTD